MKKSTILFIMVMMPVLFGSKYTPAPGKETSLVLKITSGDPKETLVFEGSYFLGGDASIFKTVKLQTPFQVERTTDVVVALVHKLSGKAELKIELLTRDGESLSPNLTGTGNVMALTTNLRENPHTHTIQIVD